VKEKESFEIGLLGGVKEELESAKWGETAGFLLGQTPVLKEIGREKKSPWNALSGKLGEQSSKSRKKEPPILACLDLDRTSWAAGQSYDGCLREICVIILTNLQEIERMVDFRAAPPASG